MRKIYQEYKREILVGVIISLLTAGIIKFGDWLVNIVPLLGASFFQVLSDAMFTAAAVNSDSVVVGMIFSALVGIGGGAILIVIIDVVRSYKKVYLLEKIARMSPEELEEFMAKPSNRCKVTKTKKDDDTLKLASWRKKLGVIIIYICLFVLLYVFSALFVIKPMELYSTFQRDMIKISPYIPEKQIVKLKSDWVCMRNKTDYNAIYAAINEVIENYSLPEG